MSYPTILEKKSNTSNPILQVVDCLPSVPTEVRAICMAICFLFVCPSSYAQETPKTKAVQIQLDALGFAQSGFGVVGGYISGKNRLDIDLLSNTLFPSFTNSTQDFDNVMTERRSVMSLVYYRYAKAKSLGFYYGAGLSYYEYIVEHDVIKETIATNTYKPGVYIGYDFMPFKNAGFYVDAWLGIRWHVEGEEEFPFSNDQYYRIPNFDGPLGMIKLGWRFNQN